MPYPPTTEPTSSVSSPVTASLVPPLFVPTHGRGGTFAVLARTRVAAPPATVLSLIRDTTSWPEWNSFCPAAAIDVGRSPRWVLQHQQRQKQLQLQQQNQNQNQNQKQQLQQQQQQQQQPTPLSLSTGSDGGLPTGKKGYLEVGTVAIVDVFMSGDGLTPGRKRSRTTTIIVTLIETLTTSLLPGEEGAKKGFRIAWKSSGWAHWQLHSERVMEFMEVDLEGGLVGTEYVCWETFGGVLGKAVKATVGLMLCDRFGDYARDVKGYLEGPGRRRAASE